MTQETLAKIDPMPAAEHFLAYSRRLSDTLAGFDWSPVVRLAEDLRDCWQTDRQVFLCGNGGSAGNASHLAN
jgi:D-sedoheptulose 7-phosphate isomerase